VNNAQPQRQNLLPHDLLPASLSTLPRQAPVAAAAAGDTRKRHAGFYGGSDVMARA